MYALLVVVVEARLSAPDRSGSCDPYVELLVDKEKRGKTEVRKKTLAPRWEHRFVLERLEAGSSVKLVCKNTASVGKPVEVGHVRLDAAGLQEGTAREKFYVLQGGKTGESRVRVLLYKVQQSRVDSLMYVEPRAAAVGHGNLTVRVERGKDLVSCDVNGFSDPYLVLKVGNVQRRTQVKERTLSPIWGEEFELEVGEEEQRNGKLTLLIWDHDRVGQDDRMGQVVIPVAQLLGKPSTKWYKVEPQKREKVSGELLVHCSFMSAVQSRKHYQVAEKHYARFRDLLCAPDAVIVSTLCRLHESSELASALLQFFSGENKMNGLMVHLLYREISRTDHESGLFRQNSMVTKLSLAFLKRHCLSFVRRIFGELLASIYADPSGLELDPRLLEEGETLERNARKLGQVCSKFLHALREHEEEFPARVKRMLATMRTLVSQKFPNSSLTSVGALLFLRFLGPCISIPESFNLVQEAPSRQQRRALTLVAKVLQNLANSVRFGEKESYLLRMNPWIDENLSAMLSFFGAVSQQVPKPSPLPSTQQERVEALSVLISDLHEHLAQLEIEMPKDPRVLAHPEKAPAQLKLYKKLTRLLQELEH